MARYRAEIQGSRGPASRLGTASSGIKGHVRGWDLGALVQCFPQLGGEGSTTHLSKLDAVQVALSGGSNEAAVPQIALTARRCTDGGLTVAFWYEGATIHEMRFNASGYKEGAA